MTRPVRLAAAAQAPFPRRSPRSKTAGSPRRHGAGSLLPVLLLPLLLLSPCLAGAQAAPSAQSAAPSAPEKPLVEQWRDVLRFGIESEVLKVLQAIAASGEEALDAELAALVRDSLSASVRLAVLRTLGEARRPSAEAAALQVLQGDDGSNPELTVALIGYLAAVRSTGAEPRLRELVDDRNDRVAEAAVAALGQTGSPASAGLLLERLGDLEYPAERKPELILALGKLRHAPATESLLQIVGSRDVDRVWRMYAASALGEIGDPAAVAPLKSLFEEEDSLLKAYAAAALSKFSMADVESLLQQALRDSNVRVRLAAAQALANRQAQRSVEILTYKARNDPERSVRLQAIASLGEIGTAFGFLREVYSDSRWLPEYREAALKALCAGDLPGSVEAIRRTVDREWAAKDQKGMELTARQLAAVDARSAQAAAGALEGLFAHLLDSPNVNVRIYALRGIQAQRYSGLRARVESLAASDPYPAARRVATAVLETL